MIFKVGLRIQPFLLMKKIRWILGLMVITACSNTSQEAQSVETVTPDTGLETEPLSYDEVMDTFKDSSSLDETRLKALYMEIRGVNSDKSTDYSTVSAQEIPRVYERFKHIAQSYKDSTPEFVHALENNFEALERRLETLDSAIDLNTKLKISEIKSEIHTALSDLRLQKIQK